MKTIQLGGIFLPLTPALSPKGRGGSRSLSPLGRGQGEGKEV